MKKLIVCILILALLLPVIPVYAEKNASNTFDPYSGLRAYNSSFHIDDYEGIKVTHLYSYTNLEIGKTNSRIVFTPRTALISPNANTLKLVIENNSECTLLTITVEYLIDGEYQRESKNVKIEPNSDKSVYTVDFDQMAKVSKVTVNFNRVLSGNIKLYSFTDMSIQKDDFGEILVSSGIDFAFDYKSHKVKISGSIGHTTYNKYRNATLEIYRTELGYDVIEMMDSENNGLYEAVLPIYTGRMSMEFSYELNVNDLVEAYSQYSIVVNDGEKRKYLCAPCVPGIESDMQDVEGTVGFKGIHSEITGDAIDINPQMSVIELDITEFESKDESGYYYDIDNKHYYFSREYFLELDKKVTAYTKSLCNVYFKLSFSENHNDDISRAEFRKDLFAYMAFLLERYGENEYIAGIVVGDRTDRFSHSGESEAVSYLNSYSAILSTIYEAMKFSGISTRIMVPVSDLITKNALDDNGYNSEIFLYSLSEKLNNRYSGFGSFYIWLCSDFLPASFEDTTGKYVLSQDNAADRHTVFDMSDFEAMVWGLANRYETVNDKYTFFWNVPTTNGSELFVNYTYNFVKLYFDSHAESFAVSFSESEKDEIYSQFLGLKSTLKFIDTERFDSVIKDLCELFGASSIKNLVDNFNNNSKAETRLYDFEFTLFPIDAKGDLFLCDFSANRSVEGWSPVYGCESMVVSPSDFGKTLVAKMKEHYSLNSEYSSIICSFDNAIALYHAQYLTCNLGIKCESDPEAVFEVVLVYGLDDKVAEAKQIVGSGEMIELTMYSDRFEKLNYLQINIKPVSNQDVEYDLHIKNVYQTSTKYSDQELEELYKKEDEEVEKDNSSDMTISEQEMVWLIVVLIGMVVVCAFVFIRVDKKNKS